jgi:hypothetical protein
MTPWSEPAFASIGPMITKQGMAVTTAGYYASSSSSSSSSSSTCFLPGHYTVSR